MSWRMLTFRCDEGHEFEDLADRTALQVPCRWCARPAVVQIRIEAPSIRGTGALSEKEKKQAVMDFGNEAYDFKRKQWRIETKGDLNKLLKKTGKVAVTDRDFLTMLDQHQAINDREANREPTADEREKRRAELVPAVKKAREIAKTAPRVNVRRDASNIPSEVRQVIPDSAKAATGVEEK